MTPGRDIRCPRCGAPLAWDGFATNVACGYCQAVVPMRAPVAAPPVMPPAPPPKGVSPVWFVLAGLAVLGLGFIALVFTLASAGQNRGLPGLVHGSAAGGVAVAEVLNVDLATTPDQLAKRFGVAVQTNAVHVDLSGARFKSISFFWEPGHLEHANMVSLTALPSGVPADVLERARAQLGRGVRPASSGGHQYSAHGVNLSIGESSVYANVHKQDDPRWKARAVAMFTLLKGIALGTNDVLDERTKRDVLNLGYPLARLAELDIGVTVEGAEREVHRVIPGAVSEAERHDVGLGHAWIENAALLWDNAERGAFKQVNLNYTKSFDFKAQREEVERCLKPLLGAPRVNTTDHLAGQVTLRFASDPKLPEVYVSHQLVIVTPTKAPDKKASFRKVIETLAACG